MGKQRKGTPAKPVSDGTGFIQKLRGRMHVTSSNIAEVTKFLQDNHAKPARADKVKDAAFYKGIYADNSIIVHDLKSATVFLSQLHHDVSGSLRTIRIIVDDSIIWLSPNDVLDAIRPIFACPPARSMADVKLTACKKSPIVVQEKPFAPFKKHKSYPYFLVEGIVGVKVGVLIKSHPGQNVVTEKVMNWCLDQGVEPPKVNFTKRLPQELREMIYANNIPTSEIEVIRCGGTSRDARRPKDLLWREFLSMALTCRGMTADVLNVVSKRCSFTLRVEAPNLETRGFFNQEAHLRTTFLAVRDTLPEWLLAKVGEVQMCMYMYRHALYIQEPLVPLLNDIATKFAPKVGREPVHFTAEDSLNHSASLFSVGVSTIPGFKIKLIFQAIPSCLLLSGHWVAQKDSFVAATLDALKLNLRWCRSHVNLDSWSSYAMVDGNFQGAEGYSVDGMSLVEVGASI